jgi:hypothetical protein
MPMSYGIYLERRKALDQDCAYTEKQFAQAIALRDRAVGAMDAAAEERDRALAERRDLEGAYPEFEEAAMERISPTDENAPADIASPRERISDFMDQAKDVFDTGLMTGGMIAQIVTATPDVHEQATPTATIEQMKQEVAREAISLEEHTTQVYEARVSAPAGEPWPLDKRA